MVVRFEYIAINPYLPDWEDKFNWCISQFGPPAGWKYDCNTPQHDCFSFVNKPDYLLFLLRWA